VPLPPAPGPGPFLLSLAIAPFYVLLALLGLFIVMFLLLRQSHPRARRALEGYLEAAGVDIAFLGFAVALVVVLTTRDPHGNRTAYALYEVIVTGYWLAFAIPIVTVGSSVHTRSRGGIPWLVPSVAVAVGLFVLFFAAYYTGY
jgi:hypothetical protein